MTKEYTLQSLISERAFDDFQVGSKSRFGGFGYSYEYSVDEHSSPCLSIRYDMPKHLGVVQISESGRLILRVLDKESGNQLIHKHLKVKSYREFMSAYPEVFIYIRDNR